MPDIKDYYAVLGVLPSIEPDALTAVYRALVKKYHPDVYKGPLDEAERITRELNEAYSVLNDPEKRDKYDQDRNTTSDGYGDFAQENFRKDQSQNTNNDSLEDWDYAVTFYPAAEIQRENLAKFSAQLAYTFQVLLLEQKLFVECKEIAAALEQEFLKTYFGSNSSIHEFVLKLLSDDQRQIALEVNKAIKILGTPSPDQTDHFIRVILDKFPAYSSSRPPGREKSTKLTLAAMNEAITLITAIEGNCSPETMKEMEVMRTDLSRERLTYGDLDYLRKLLERINKHYRPDS